MSRRGRSLLIGGLLFGLAIALVVIYGVASPHTPEAPRPPELGGQKVPEKVFDIQFDRPYDLFCSFYGPEPMVFRNCTIVGFSGRGEDSARSGRTSGIGVFSSPSGSSSYSYQRHFEHWLVLRRADGRLVYIPPEAVKYIEEAAGPTETKTQPGGP